MFRCEHFKIQELVSPDVFNDRGMAAWELLDERALITLDALREEFGPCTVNDWCWGGQFKYSGFRESDCSVGAKYSQHKLGRAFDCKFRDTDAETVRQVVLRCRNELFPHISGIELNVSWFHFDVRNHTPLKVFTP